MAVSNIMAQFNNNVPSLKASASSNKPDAINRFMGGKDRQNHPFISGYWYFVVQLPTEIFSTGIEDQAKWLHSTAESFTPPSKTLNKVDVVGMGGSNSSFISGSTLNRTFTVGFREYQNVPILSIFDKWTAVIDPRLGLSPLKKFVPSAYKGSAFAILAKPQSRQGSAGISSSNVINEEDIEQIYLFDGVFPEMSPHDAFAVDISANDVVQLSVAFSFDGWPLTNEVAGLRKLGADTLNKNVGTVNSIDKLVDGKRVTLSSF